MQKNIENGSPGKPRMKIKDNWMLMSLLKGAISSAPATKEILDELKSMCADGAMIEKHGKKKMDALFEISKKDQFSVIFTIATIEKYAKEDLIDMEEHIKFLEAYSEGKLSSYVPQLIRKVREMDLLESEKKDIGYVLMASLKKEKGACVHAITEVLACVYNFKAGKKDYKNFIESLKEVMDAW